MREADVHRNRSAMTMTELIVAVAVLSIMVLGFGQLLTSSQKVVKETQDNQRQNNVAQAVADVIRADLGKITKNGFLCITQRSTYTSHPRLLFTTAGMSPSKTDAVVGSGGISVYGPVRLDLRDGFGFDTNCARGAMLRQGWVMSTDSVSGISDVWNTDLDTITSMTRVEMNELIGNYSSSGPESGTLLRAISDDHLDLDWPPTDLNELKGLWQFLSTRNTAVDIMWTDGSKSGTDLNWYGVRYVDPYERVPKNDGYPSWSSVSGSSEAARESFLETNMEFKAYGGGYRALWTRHDQSNWPKAIKLVFRVYDEAMAGEFTTQSTSQWYNRYEVIVPID